MKILVIGRGGQVARALVRRAATRGLAVEALGRPEVDLARPESVHAAIAARRPQIVINAAAYTAVDKAEDESERAFLINAHGAEVVASAAACAGARLIHVSTDYVFPGDKTTRYLEDDETGPRSVYGASKLDGERLVGAAHPDAVIVRTAWVFDAAGANFVRTMLRLAKVRPEVSVVSDQVGCPTFADDFADALLTIAGKARHAGVYHCAGAGDTSWAGFARAIFAEAQERGGPAARVREIYSHDYPVRAARPANSRLDCAKIAADYGVRMRSWREALAACIDEIAADGWSVG